MMIPFESIVRKSYVDRKLKPGCRSPEPVSHVSSLPDVALLSIYPNLQGIAPINLTNIEVLIQ